MGNWGKTFLWINIEWEMLEEKIASLHSLDPSESIDTHIDLVWPFFDLTWPQIWPWPFKVKMGIFRTVSTRETQWWQNQCSSINRCKVIHEKPSDKNQPIDPGEIWPLGPKRLTLGQIWWHSRDRELHCASAGFLNLLLAAFVWAPEPFKC